MARPKKATQPDTEFEGRIAFDPSVGAYRDLSTGLVYLPGDQQPGVEVVKHPILPPGAGRRGLAAARGVAHITERLIHDSGQVFGGGGWGTPVKVWYYTKGPNKGKPRFMLPAGVVAIGVVGLLTAYAIERAEHAMAHWWPGSTLAVSDWGSVSSPVPLSSWLASNFNVNQWINDLQSLAAQPGPAGGASKPSTTGFLGNLYKWVTSVDSKTGTIIGQWVQQ